MLLRLILISCLALFLFACAPVSVSQPASTITLPAGATITPTVQTSTPTLSTPTPNVEVDPAQAVGPAETPTFEPTLPEVTEAIPTITPNVTDAATPIPQPWANSSAIQIYSPGPQSKIISPLVIYGYAIPGYKHKGRVDLYGEDGRLLKTEDLQLNTVYKWAYFYWPLPFAINSAGELGRLTMSTQDEYGRLTAVNSIHLLLLPEGSSIIYPPGDLDLTERCKLEQPAQGQKPGGGTLTISGKMLPFNSLPLTIALVGRDGIMLNSQLVPLTPDGANSVPFRVDLPYSLQKGAWELLTVSQFDDRIGGLMYLYSQEIFLNP